MKILAVAILTVVLVTACHESAKVVSKDDLIRYISNTDNELVKEHEVSGIEARLRYQPASLLVAQELQGTESSNQQVITALKKKYSGKLYFLLKYSKQGKEAIRELGSYQRYSDMVTVLSFEMTRFVNLTTPQRDTIALADYIFDQTYGMGDANVILLAFNSEKLKGKNEFSVNVGECGFGTGPLSFKFQIEDLERVPQLDYSGDK